MTTFTIVAMLMMVLIALALFAVVIVEAVMDRVGPVSLDVDEAAPAQQVR